MALSGGAEKYRYTPQNILSPWDEIQTGEPPQYKAADQYTEPLGCYLTGSYTMCRPYEQGQVHNRRILVGRT